MKFGWAGRSIRALASCAAWLAFGTAQATTLLVIDADGKLAGATGLTVGDRIYSVEFVDGSCASLFTGCDSNADFAFSSSSDAVAASIELVRSVFVGRFDSDPGLTRGCQDQPFCHVITPYASRHLGHAFEYVDAMNGLDDDTDGVTVPLQDEASRDLSAEPHLAFARWTEAITVPEPGSLELALAATAGWILRAALRARTARRARRLR